MASVTLAQEQTVSGTVTSAEDNQPVPGVNVVVKGSTVGTVTNIDGEYRLTVPSSESVIEFSFIGFASQEVTVGNQSTVDVSLQSDVQSLQEVVVTAQGVERDERSLGYSVQQLEGEVIQQKSSPDVLNSLQGKVAGVNITSGSGAPGASTNINIRGFTSFNGNNQPLVVIDEIIFSNDVDNGSDGVGGINTLFGNQPTNRLGDLNPEDIASINVLKGPAAAALYGSRASNGAILITTKSGKGLKGRTQVTLTHSTNFQTPSYLPELQNTYGQGSQNRYINTTGSSWGPQFGLGSYPRSTDVRIADGQPVVTTLQEEEVPFQAYPDNINDFYRTGRIIQNTVSIAGGDADKSFILSLGNTNQRGIVRNSELARYNVSVGGSSKLDNGLVVDGKINYAQNNQLGSVQGNGGSAFGQITRIPRSFDLVGRPFADPNTGQSIYYSASNNHPLWSLENEVVDTQVDRVFGNFSIGYDIAPWLNVRYRVTADVYTDRRKFTQAIGSGRAPTGQVTEDLFFRSELNGDLLISANKSDVFTDGLNFDVLLGHNLNQRDFQNQQIQADELTIPNFYNVNNAAVFTGSEEFSSQRRLVGYYGQISANYREFLFAEFTGRYDQSSTLPTENSGYFYPAGALSFVVTEALGIDSDILPYLKVRGSAARVGRDADPYLLNSVFVTGQYGNNVANIQFPLSVGGSSVPGFQIGSRVGNANLTPEFTTSYEGGINVGLFNNRLTLDATYFYTVSRDQILDVTIAAGSGFSTLTTNSGEMENRGLEFLLNATPVRSGDLTWDVSLNYTRIRNEVLDIIEGVDIANESSVLDGNSFIGIAPSIRVGEPYGVIISRRRPRNDAGELLINPETGTYQPYESGVVVADPNPDWTAGLTNTIRYKGFTLSALVDTQQGGELYSFTIPDQRSNGSLAVTGVDREQPRILPGVIENSDGTFRPNNIQISSQRYWGGLGGLADEGAAFDATTYRLRELSLSYSLPASLLENSPFGDVTIGVSGRNLLLYAPGFPGDPEINKQGAGNIRGLDLNGPPNVRNYGFNVRVTL
ncbi:SusC/RagA family TonB-linked outer membrane protein [Tunicatimonas pelagia]|nr:SusC/RagA family TonB-linked outer membrane protein [Tunicatimonas pelagia]WKN46333.1 SusC/RagA family TonB-linked outer membrane protein [Tunicatimonas pelagia]